MHRYDRDRQKLALGLAFLAGQVDATGYVIAGGYFSSFMSGNTTRMGVDAIAEPVLALLPLAVIGSFFAGVVAGALVARRWQGRHKRILLAIVALLLGSAALVHGLAGGSSFLLLAAMAMGLSNNVFSRDGEVTVGVTYMTGALVRAGQGLAGRIAGRPGVSTRGYGQLWVALAAGAGFGAWLHHRAPLPGIWFAAAMAAGLCLYATSIERRRS